MLREASCDNRIPAACIPWEQQRLVDAVVVVAVVADDGSRGIAEEGPGGSSKP